MQMRALGGAGVPEFGYWRPRLHRIADFHRDAALAQMRVPGKDIWSDFENEVVAAIVCLRLGDHQDGRRLIGHAVVDVDHGAIGDREDVLAEAILLLDPLAVAVEESVVLNLGPVDGEGLGGLDADAVYRDTKVSVEVGLAASGGRVIAPNPCSYPETDLYARILCHEIGHANGWPATHGRDRGSHCVGERRQ